MRRTGISEHYVDELLAEFSVLEAAVCGGISLLSENLRNTSTIVSGIELQLNRMKDLIMEIPAVPNPDSQIPK